MENSRIICDFILFFRDHKILIVLRRYSEINLLATLGAIEVKVKGQGSCLKIPTPREQSQKLLEALNIRLPNALPHREVTVVTRKKLMKERKFY